MDTLRPSTRAEQHDFYITFLDGTKIKGFSVTHTVCLALQKIGVQKVVGFALRAKTKRKGVPYVSRFKTEIEGNYPWVKVDGYYVLRTINAPNWQTFLEEMNNDLRLGITVRYIKNK